MKELEKLCEQRKVKLVDKGNGHLQLQGPLLVNYYPNSKKRSAYVAGSVKAATHVSPQQAVAMCFKPPKPQGKIAQRKKSYTRLKRRMLKKQKTCYWCDEPLTDETATVEHIIPLSRGGLDNDNNRTLAHESCNRARGNSMPELKNRLAV